MSIFGNISKAGSYYNKKNKILYVRGWFLDPGAYDKITINGSEAVIGIERQDVYNNFNEYSPNCGFEFCERLEEFNGRIMIDILLNEEIVFSREYIVPIVEYSLEKTKQKKLVLLGIDETIERFYYQYRDRFEFCFFHNRVKTQNKFYDLQWIDFPELIKDEQCDEYLFVIGDKEKDYYSGLLRNNGKHEFNDFYIASVLQNLLEQKKMILLHGNCHITRVKTLLVECLKDMFFVYDIPLIYLNRKNEIDSDVLANADVFIHQDIQKDNKYGYKLSDEYILKQLNLQCTEICIPNLFGIGRAFFPQSMMGNDDNHIYRNGIGLFPYKDIVAEKMCEDDSKEITMSKIQEKAEELFDQKYILENFNKYMDILCDREKYCHVKISEYIKKNYRYVRIFWDAEHPTGDVLKEMCRQIVEILQVDMELEDLPKHVEMDTYQTPVYEKVKSVLGLKWQDDEMRVVTDNKLAEKMDVIEYVKEYLYWCTHSFFS